MTQVRPQRRRPVTCHSGERIGLGAGRVDPEWARFRSVSDLVRYLSDLDLLTQAELAERCGVRREQVSRWQNGSHQPTVARLSEVVERLGWHLVLGLEHRGAELDAMLTRPTRPEWQLRPAVAGLLRELAEARPDGLDVVIGGEVAAVLHGVPESTMHLVLHVRPEQREELDRLVQRCVQRERAEHARPPRPVTPDPPLEPAIRVARRQPANVLIALEEHRLPVIDLDELLADPDGVGPRARALAGRLIGRADRRPD